MISYKGTRENDFSEIDNADYSGEIRNFVFIPTYGFDSKANGVIQLFNKAQGAPSESELEKLRPYQRLVGIAMQSVKEGNRVMNIGAKMQSLLQSMSEQTASYQLAELGYSSSLDQLDAVVDNLQRILINNEKYKKARRNSFTDFA